MVMTTGEFAKFMWPGLNVAYSEEKNRHKDEWKVLFNKQKSDKPFEETKGILALGISPVINEGAPVTYSGKKPGFTYRFTHVKYGQGIIATEEFITFHQYKGTQLESEAGALAFANHQTRNTIAANVFNRAFNSSYAGGDGKELCATDHPNVHGGTWQNELTIAADLSEASLEQACIDIGKWTTDAGGPIKILTDKLIIPGDLEFDALRILKSIKQNDTALNAINALRIGAKFPGGIHTNPWFTDTDAWFILTKVPNALIYYEVWDDKLQRTEEFDTNNVKWKSTFMGSFGWCDPHAVYGSPGA